MTPLTLSINFNEKVWLSQLNTFFDHFFQNMCTPSSKEELFIMKF